MSIRLNHIVAKEKFIFFSLEIDPLLQKRMSAIRFFSGDLVIGSQNANQWSQNKDYGVFIETPTAIELPRLQAIKSLEIQVMDGNRVADKTSVELQKSHWIESIDLPDSVDVIKTSENSTGKKEIILLQNLYPYPENQGNKVVLSQLIDWLEKQDYFIRSIVQIGEDSEALARFSEKVDELYLVDMKKFLKNKHAANGESDRYHPVTHQLVHSLVREKTAGGIVQYAAMASNFQYLPDKVRTACFTHDVQHRFKNEFVSKNVEVNANRICSRGEESRQLSFCETIVAINGIEQQMLKNMLPYKNHIVVKMHKGNIEFVPPAKANKKMLFVASDNEPNFLSLKIFFEKCWPAIVKAHPDATFDVVGTVCRRFDGVQIENVNFKGFVDSLEAEYERAHLLLNLTEMGTGLKIKTIEALAYGKAVVSTLKGAEGIADNGEPPCLVVQGFDDLHDAIIELLNNPDEIAAWEDKSRKFANDFLSEEAVYGTLKVALQEKPIAAIEKKPLKVFFDVTELVGWTGSFTGIQKVVSQIGNQLDSMVSDLSYVMFDRETSQYKGSSYFSQNSADFQASVAAKDMEGSFVLILSGGWHDSSYLSVLDGLKQQSNFKLVHFVHDVIPLVEPQFFGPKLPEAYAGWFQNIVNSVDLVLTNSVHSKSDMQRYVEHHFSKAAPPIEVIRLGDTGVQ